MESIHKIQGPALLLAGPGTGKTYTLGLRLKYLIDEMDVPTDSITVITFTADAAKNMRSRISDPEKEALSDFIRTNLRKTTPSKLIVHLIREDEASHQTLSQVASVSPQAITFHTKRLAQFGIIESSKEGRQKFYRLSPPAREITQALLR